MTWRERIAEAAERIADAGSDAPQQEARELFRHALGLSRREALLLEDQFEPGPVALVRFESLVARRAAHEPLQYLLGTVPFCEIDLEVGPGALIPRPETEVLVERVTTRLREAGWGGLREAAGYGRGKSGVDGPGGSREADRSRDAARSRDVDGARDVDRSRGAERSAPFPWVLDVGTGTGAILLALLARFPRLRGVGLDLSAEALTIASRNVRRFTHAQIVPGNIDSGRATLLRGRWLDPIGLPSAPVAAIVSNPPYIPSREVPSLAPEIREHEPLVALDGGEDGLDFLEPITEGALRLLAPGGLLALELAFDQADRVATALGTHGLEPIEIYRDLAGRERGIIARRG